MEVPSSRISGTPCWPCLVRFVISFMLSLGVKSRHYFALYGQVDDSFVSLISSFVSEYHDRVRGIPRALGTAPGCQARHLCLASLARPYLGLAAGRLPGPVE